MQCIIDLAVAERAVEKQKACATMEKFRDDCAVALKAHSNMIDVVSDALGNAKQQEVLEGRSKLLIDKADVMYRGLIDKLASTRLKIADKKQTQIDRNRKEREAAAFLSSSEVVEGFIGEVLDKRLGRESKTNVDFGSMVNIDQGVLNVKTNVVMKSDQVEVDDAVVDRRRRSKRALAELKKHKAEAKNGKSPGPTGGSNRPSAAAPKAKPKAKGKGAEAKKQPDKGKGKGKEPGKGKNKGKTGKSKEKGPESNGSGKNTGRGSGKGRQPKGQGKSQ